MAKTKKRKHRKLDRSLPVMRPNAGGIDIGATEIFVAVPADRETDSVRSFPTFTQDLHALADWLQQCRVDTVAMESTGVYWIPLFQILEARGIEVHLVNAQHVHHDRPRRISQAETLPTWSGSCRILRRFVLPSSPMVFRCDQ